MTGTVLSETIGPGVMQVTIDRPQRRNALDRATYAGLIAAITAAEADEAIRAVVLTGAAGCFTSGNDIADFAADGPAGAQLAMDFLGVISTARKPVVAAVEGFAVGIGTTVLLHCDLAYAGADARFRLPFIALGLTPEGASSHLLPLVAGNKRAAELLMLGEPFTAETAAAAGLVNAVVASGTALALAHEKALALAALPREALLQTKLLLKRGSAAAVAEALAVEARIFGERLVSAEAKAAFAAFLKR